jgi:hypothetical protein
METMNNSIDYSNGKKPEPSFSFTEDNIDMDEE